MRNWARMTSLSKEKNADRDEQMMFSQMKDLHVKGIL
jgi:hypothetical protein